VSRPALAVKGLGRRFGATLALDDIGLEVAEGEVLALLGENGAGKSTLVEILAGGLRPDRGTIEVGGAPYRPRGSGSARAAGIGVVHQHFQLVEAFTVLENLCLGLDTQRPEALVSRWLELAERLSVDLPDPEAVVRTLGVGARQWLEVGKALLGRPRLLLLDEPTAVLTPGESGRLLAMVRALAGKGAAAVLITHRLDEVRQAADRVVVLRRGRVVTEQPATAPPAELAAAMAGELPVPPPRPPRLPGPVVARLLDVAAPPRLAPLCLDLRAGEVVVLAGVDGGGQMAAAERLAGFTRGPGSIEVRGSTVERVDPRAMHRLGVRVIAADRSRQGVAASLTVAENLVLGERPRGSRLLAPRQLEQDAEILIRRFGIVGRPDQAVRELSGGNQQKVVVARALAAEPVVLVAMHPTRGLDVAAQEAVRRQLVEAAGADRAVLVVTADLDEAVKIGDRVLVMSRGRVVGEGDRSTPVAELASWLGGEAA